jgi:anti-sigma factor RsiW
MNLSTDKCKFGDSLVAYLYDEMPAADRGVFEEHLAGCEACTDEFAGLSVARFEVFDWKRKEFDALETPRIVVPYPAAAQAGWFEGLRAALSWATVVPAMAALLVVLGVGYVLWSNSAVTKAPEVASNVAVTPAAVPAPVVAPEVKQVVEPSIVAVDTKPTPRKVAPRNEVAAVKASKMLAPQRRVVSPVNTNNDVAVVVRPNSKPSPRLTAYNDDDDTSLRLSDLFEETGPPEE